VDTETPKHEISHGKSWFRSSDNGVRGVVRRVTAFMSIYAESGVMMWPFTSVGYKTDSIPNSWCGTIKPRRLLPDEIVKINGPSIETAFRRWLLAGESLNGRGERVRCQRSGEICCASSSEWQPRSFFIDQTKNDYAIVMRSVAAQMSILLPDPNKTRNLYRAHVHHEVEKNVSLNTNIYLF